MSDHNHDHDHDQNPLQAYFDWQVDTIMLAHDASNPGVADEDVSEARRKEIEQEVARLTLAVVPDVFKNDPELAWPPEVMREITRATLKHATAIVGE